MGNILVDVPTHTRGMVYLIKEIRHAFRPLRSTFPQRASRLRVR
jgi:hypothetical protein